LNAAENKLHFLPQVSMNLIRLFQVIVGIWQPLIYPISQQSVQAQIYTLTNQHGWIKCLSHSEQ